MAVSRRAIIGGSAGVAVLAGLGYRAWDRGVFESANGPAFAPWDEWRGYESEGITRPLHAAILAANPHDTQPWLFMPQGDTIRVFADRRRNLGSFDPYRREMFLGLGCAIGNLQVAADLFRFVSNAQFFGGRLTLSPPDTPIEVARVRLAPKNAPDGDVRDTASPADLARAIPFRHTNRGPYMRDRSVPAGFMDGWSRTHATSAARVVFITRPQDHAAMRRIIVGATEAIIADPQMSADSARWFRTGKREIEEHRDGVTTDTAGLSPLMVMAAKLIPDQDAHTADGYWLAMTRDTQTATAPVFGMILVRDRFDAAQSLTAGRLWQWLHLAATRQGLAAHPMNQPVEMMDRNLMFGRNEVFKRALTNVAQTEDGWEPTFVFRMGYAQRSAGPSPRRPLRDVITTGV